ncbi:Hypothetical Protein FCC1311_044332 [Hondaea fermentalgiana]|uniref:Uncharacterized protein n=1 Tax=Hondaea fermentalgiana TaxID=2315210 RepID=A0A2R5GB36_9STRA|nr:Hypothetical Protein FCC1311_044332 [Hondaea fermentalgiana]|eukprot:GBG28210.1 Hypothetical Protein FCC1311_044332 [Hondaea fermentalgiana]
MSRNAGAASGTQPNPINVMKQWAAHCEKELTMSDKWFENWSEVYFPDQKIGNVDDRVDELSRRAAELKSKMEEVNAERSKIELEVFESPFRVKSSALLKPAYPHRG